MEVQKVDLYLHDNKVARYDGYQWSIGVWALYRSMSTLRQLYYYGNPELKTHISSVNSLRHLSCKSEGALNPDERLFTPLTTRQLSSAARYLGQNTTVSPRFRRLDKFSGCLLRILQSSPRFWTQIRAKRWESRWHLQSPIGGQKRCLLVRKALSPNGFNSLSERCLTYDIQRIRDVLQPSLYRWKQSRRSSCTLVRAPGRCLPSLQ